jgi:hypothetical protein
LFAPEATAINLGFMRVVSEMGFGIKVWRPLPRTNCYASSARIILTLAIGWLTSVRGFADGCFVFEWNQAIDINEPTQKAIIVHDQGREDLLLQVKYEGPLEDFGWLIPVPSLPKVKKGSMEPFYELSQLTQRKFGGSPTKGVATLGVLSAGRDEVEVIEIKTVGAYEVAVLSARDSGSLARWLKAHGYSIPDGKREIVEEYIRKGWYFIAAKIHLNKGVGFREISKTSPKGSEASGKAREAVRKQLSSGELHPLLISFDTATCIYPLKISAVGGKPSEVSLYVLSGEPLLESFTFGQACAKLAGSYAEWEQQRPQRLGASTKAMQESRQITLTVMMTAPRNPVRSPESTSRPRDWSNEDMEALARESTMGYPEPNLDHAFSVSPELLLQQMRLESGKTPQSAKAIPRLRGKDWNLTKVVWTFSPAEMQDLEFVPAIPALAPMMSEEHGGVAGQLLAQFGDEGIPVLLAACKSRNPTERLNAVCALEYGRRSIPYDLLMALIQDESPRVRLQATRYAYLNWDQRLTDTMVALLRDQHLEIRQEAGGCLSSHESTNRTSFYLGLLNDPDPNVRARALGIADRISRRSGSDEVYRAALPMLKDPNEIVQSAAVNTLLGSHQPVPIPDLLPLLNHPYPDTVAFVANMLRGGGRIRYVGDKRESLLPVASADLAPLMTNRFGNVRLIGLRAMQDIADATAVELTLPLLRDTNSVIRSRAFTVVQEITGQDISDSDPAKWEAWWAANQHAFTPRKSAP